MHHFLEISSCSSAQLKTLIHRALELKQTRQYPSYPEHTVAHLFYENSTRTSMSFEMAARHLSLSVRTLNLQNSSENKGEIIEDTLRTLAAMGIQLFVIRHKQEGLQQHLADTLGNSLHIINAGDGRHAHPSQAVLDMMTILEQKPRLDKLKIAILGNVRHSRVAHSFQSLCSKLGVGELVLVAPKLWQPTGSFYGRVTEDLVEGLTDADVIMCLRIQKERLLEQDHLDLETYRRHFALTQKTLAYAKPNAMVMHPGPMNRGVEIDSEVADGVQSFILQQVTNGVFARMAILESLIRSS